MNLRELRTAAAGRARKVKEEHVRRVKGHPGQTDIRTLIEGYRGQDPVVVVFTSPDRDRMLNVAGVVAVGFSADAISLTFESFVASGPETASTNPDTGEDWGPGEMGDYFDRHGPGLVMECLTTMIYNRAGDDAFVSQPYVLHGRRVDWQPVPEFDEGAAGGVVHDALTEIMARQTVMQMAGSTLANDPALKGMPYERALFHADMAALTVIERLGEDLMVMLYAKPGSVRHQLLRERLDRGAILNPNDRDD